MIEHQLWFMSIKIKIKFARFKDIWQFFFFIEEALYLQRWQDSIHSAFISASNLLDFCTWSIQMDQVQQYKQHLKFRGIPYKITAHCRKPFL